MSNARKGIAKLLLEYPAIPDQYQKRNLLIESNTKAHCSEHFYKKIKISKEPPLNFNSAFEFCKNLKAYLDVADEVCDK